MPLKQYTITFTHDQFYTIVNALSRVVTDANRAVREGTPKSAVDCTAEYELINYLRKEYIKQNRETVKE